MAICQVGKKHALTSKNFSWFSSLTSTSFVDFTSFLSHAGGSLSWNRRCECIGLHSEFFRELYKCQRGCVAQEYNAHQTGSMNAGVTLKIQKKRRQNIEARNQGPALRSEYQNQWYARWFSKRLLLWDRPIFYRGRSMSNKEWRCSQSSFMHWIFCGQFNHPRHSNSMHIRIRTFGTSSF